MVEKLKSISRRIPWYLVLKAVSVGFIWFLTPSVLPFWFFIAVVFGLYLIPLFQPLKTGLVFLIFLGFAGFLEINPVSAILLSAIFFLILGIKDYVLINRARAFELLVFLYIAVSSLQFFSWFSGPFIPGLLLWDLAGAVIFYILATQAVSLVRETSSKDSEEEMKPELRSVPAILAVVLWQLTWALLFLPMEFYLQAAFFTAIAAVLLDLGLEYVRGALKPKRILIDFSLALTITVVILTLMGSGL